MPEHREPNIKPQTEGIESPKTAGPNVDEFGQIVKHGGDVQTHKQIAADLPKVPAEHEDEEIGNPVPALQALKNRLTKAVPFDAKDITKEPLK